MDNSTYKHIGTHTPITNPPKHIHALISDPVLHPFPIRDCFRSSRLLLFYCTQTLPVDRRSVIKHRNWRQEDREER